MGKLAVLFMFLGLGVFSWVQASNEFLSEIDHGFQSTHGLKYQFNSEQLSAAGPVHRTDQFGENPYQISVAAFIEENKAVMIHAERVVDGSGASNYDELPPADWPDRSFRSSGPVCVDIPRSETEGEHDLEWLQANGFDPAGPMVFVQYFATTGDYNDEIVVSLLARTDSCPGTQPLSHLVSALQESVEIRSID